jgi:hypothetical protein
MHKIIHSLHSSSYVKSIAPSKQALHRARYSTSSYKFQFAVFSLRSSSTCLRLLPRLPVASFFLYLSFNNVC